MVHIFTMCLIEACVSGHWNTFKASCEFCDWTAPSQRKINMHQNKWHVLEMQTKMQRIKQEKVHRDKQIHNFVAQHPQQNTACVRGVKVYLHSLIIVKTGENLFNLVVRARFFCYG